MTSLPEKIHKMQDYLQGLIDCASEPRNPLTIEQIRSIGYEIERTKKWITQKQNEYYQTSKVRVAF